MTTKAKLQKILEEILHTDEEDRCNQENAKKNKLHKPSRLTNKKEGKNKHQEKNKMIGNNIYLSVLTLNVNGLNSPTKRHRIANCIKKQDLTFVAYKRLILPTKTNIGLE
jgi:hypothetical protein